MMVAQTGWRTLAEPIPASREDGALTVLAVGTRFRAGTRTDDYGVEIELEHSQAGHDRWMVRQADLRATEDEVVLFDGTRCRPASGDGWEAQYGSAWSPVLPDSVLDVALAARLAELGGR